MATPPELQRSGMLGIIRIALIAGLLVFGAMTAYVHGQPTWAPADLETLRTLRTLGWAVWGLALLAILALRFGGGVIERSPYASRAIVGWALGEGGALYGCVYYFLSGDERWYFAGLIFIAASFILFPVRRQ